MGGRDGYLVTCIIPIFNAEKYLSEAIESVISQSVGFHRVQLILVDDGSTDKSAEICARYSSRYPNILYLYQANSGVSSARNHGLQKAEGCFLCFLDADDMLDAGFMETGLRFLKKHETNFAAFPMHYIRENKVEYLPLPLRFQKEGLIDITTDYEKIQFSVWGALIRKEAADILFREPMRYLEDAEYMHRLVHKNMQYGVVNTSYYLYRKHTESVMHQKRYDPQWYSFQFIDCIYQNSMQSHGYITRYTQYLAVYSLLGYFDPSIPAGIMEGIHEIKHMAKLKEILEPVAPAVIERLQVPNAYKFFFLKTKYDIYKKIESNHQIIYYFETYGFSMPYQIQIKEITVAAGDAERKTIEISGYLHLPDYEDFRLFLSIAGKGREIKPKLESRHNLFYLGNCICKAFEFQEQVTMDGSCEISFYLGYHMKLQLAGIQYQKEGTYQGSILEPKNNCIRIV